MVDLVLIGIFLATLGVGWIIVQLFIALGPLWACAILAAWALVGTVTVGVSNRHTRRANADQTTVALAAVFAALAWPLYYVGWALYAVAIVAYRLGAGKEDSDG